MKLFVCLVAFFASTNAVSYGPAPIITIEDVERVVASLEGELQILQQELAEGRTRCDEGQAKINEITEVFLPRAELDNKQENDRIDNYKVQVKAIQHRVDAAKGKTEEVYSWATETRNMSLLQLDYLADPVGVSDTEEDAKIYQLHADIERVKREFLEALNHTLIYLYQDWESTRSDVHDFRAYINSGKCEYGIGAFDPNNPYATSFVPFKTHFGTEPHVSLYLTGFSSDLDVHSYDQYDGLHLVKYVSNVNTTGFTVGATDASEGMVEVKQFFCSWVACQDIDGEYQR